MSKYRYPQFTHDADVPINRVRCPVHGFIHYSENERQVIDHPLFRRLRYIRQLALTEFLYPGATHSRFEHALGVMEVATRAFDAVAIKQGDLMEETFSRVEGFADAPMEKARQVLRLAALLHDVGHGSFSHAAEPAMFPDSGHEALSVKIVSDRNLLGNVIDQLFWEGCAKRVAQVINGSPELPRDLILLRNLVSGEMDADRTDYLLRDSLHCGVDYGRFDHRRMIESLEVQETDLGLEIALNRDGIHTFEALILARYQMNTQVYYHRLRRIYDHYLIKYFNELKEDVALTPEYVIDNNDITMMVMIMEDAERGPEKRKKWAERIVRRNHHRMVYETGENLNAISSKKFKQLYSKIQEQFPDIEFIRDISQAGIHKILTPKDDSDEGRATITLIGPGKSRRGIGEESQIFQSIPRNFQCGRIFADLTHEQTERRKEVVEFAGRMWKQL